MPTRKVGSTTLSIVISTKMTIRSVHDFNDVFQDSSDINVMRSRYRREGLLLQLRGIIGPSGGWLFNVDLFHIKDEIKELFEDVGGLRKRTTRKPK